MNCLRRGQCGVVHTDSVTEEDAALLEAMGLCDQARVRLCRHGEPCIVAVEVSPGVCCRIGLARRLAERINVLPEEEA
jgi:hypothetical protein